MALDPSIILQGRGPDIMGALTRSNDAAQAQRNNLRQRDIEQLYKTEGAGMLAGNQNSLNALAGYDPGAAQGLVQNQLAMDQTRQSMSISAEEMQMKRDEGKRLAGERMADKAATLTKEQAAQAAAQLDKAIQAAATAKTPEQWDAIVTQFGEPDLAGQWSNKDGIIAGALGFKDWFDAFNPEPDKPADEYQRYVQEETAKGATPLGRIEFAQAQKGKGITQTITNPDGTTTTISIGGADGGTGAPTVGQVYNPNEISSVITMIDEIANNPNLDRVLGPIEGGGGNNIDDIGMTARAYYGGDGTALIERIGQLQNNAWLSARQMLKGGGAITDYESRKAEGAVARLSRAKSEAEFKTALKDLRDAITEGEAKLKARGQSAAASPPSSPAGPGVSPPTVPQFDNDADYLKSLGLE